MNRLTAAAAAPATAAICSLLYLVGWCAVSNLTIVQSRTVFRAERTAVLGLLALDAGRATVLSLLVLAGFGLTGKPIARADSVSIISWIAVGLSSFFVGVRLPPSFGFAVPQSGHSGAQIREDADSSARSSSLASSLYTPNVGFLREVRRNCAARFTAGVAKMRSQIVALRLGREQREADELLDATTSLDDVMRVITEVREYVSQAGLLTQPQLASLIEYLELIEIDVLTGPGPPGDHYSAAIKALLYRLQREGLDALRSQILATARILRRGD